MRFIALATFKKNLTKEVVGENLKDIEEDAKEQIQYRDIYWTLGRLRDCRDLWRARTRKHL